GHAADPGGPAVGPGQRARGGDSPRRERLPGQAGPVPDLARHGPEVLRRVTRASRVKTSARQGERDAMQITNRNGTQGGKRSKPRANETTEKPEKVDAKR